MYWDVTVSRPNRSIRRLVTSILVPVIWTAMCGGLSAAEPVTYQPLEYSADAWQGSTYWGDGDWARVGKDWHHPGKASPTARSFLVPADGRVSIAGRVYKLDTGGGDGVKLAVRLDDRTLWESQIEAKDRQGVEPRLSIDVRKGQWLRFVVSAGGTHFHDSTHWDPIVTYPDGMACRASEAFSEHQGRGGWRYEWEVNAANRHLIRPVRPSLAGLDLAGMVRAEWLYDDRIDGTPDGYARAIAWHLPRTVQLLDDLRQDRPADFLADEKAQLSAIAHAARTPAACDEKLYLTLRDLKRRVALANPAMDFGRLLFCKRSPGKYSHLVMQYYGFFARPGGGLFVLDRPGRSLEAHDILEGQLSDGNIVEPQISYDGRKVLFSFVRCTGKSYDINQLDNRDNHDFYHIYEANVDGTGLRQLTNDAYDDLMPNYLPDGSIVFSSTRRGAHVRCFHRRCGTRWQSYTLYRMDADGGNIRPLSYHDTNEWYPSVMPSGQILYARWDYIDRDAVTHQNLWLTRPDGTNPQALWGNATPNPHCAFQAKPVPGGNKIVFIASAHHSVTAGSVVLLDPTVDNNSPAAIRRLTPEVVFPESEGKPEQYYAAPWPLSEKYFLVAYSPVPLVFEPGLNPRNALGIYLLDVFGNRELIYRDPDIGSTNPIPLTPRPCPQMLPNTLAAESSPTGTMILTDVYRGLGNVPRGRIKELRVVEIFPKTTPYSNEPPIGVAHEENARAILGTVPVEDDGSAYFELPAGRPVLFQALDAEGMAYQTMRSVTYVQPGERVSCAGCHEDRMSAPPSRPPKALGRAPSKIDPGPMGGSPFSFVRFVQPVLDGRCVKCHGGEKVEKNVNLTRDLVPGSGGFTQSYVALTRDAKMVPRYPMRNQVQVTAPGGGIGAMGSGLMKLVRSNHGDVTLSDDELRRLSAWIDLNAVYFGSYAAEDNAREVRGEPIPMPGHP
jgi:hypothetical protein